MNVLRSYFNVFVTARTTLRAGPSLAAERESLSAAVTLVSRPTERLRVCIARTITDRRDGRRSIAITPVVGDLFASD